MKNLGKKGSDMKHSILSRNVQRKLKVISLSSSLVLLLQACDAEQYTQCLSNGETVQVSRAETDCPSAAAQASSGITNNTVTTPTVVPVADTMSNDPGASVTSGSNGSGSSVSGGSIVLGPVVVLLSNPPVFTNYFAITARTASDATLAWQRAVDDRTAPANLEYRLVYSLDSNLITADAALTPTPTGVVLVTDWTRDITSGSMTGLTASTTYYAAVFSRDDEGKVAMLGPKTVVTNAPNAPIIGTPLTYSNVSTNSLDINWGAASDVLTLSSAIEYRVVRADDAVTLHDLAAVSAATPISAITVVQDWTPNVTSLSVSGLSAGTDYAFAVVVRGAPATTALYDPSTIRTADVNAPVVGSDIVYSNILTTSLTATWGSATDDVTVASHLEYKLVRASSASAIDSIAEIQALPASSIAMDWSQGITSRALTGLGQGQRYYFNYLVRDHSGNMSISSPVKVVMQDTVSPVVGANITFASVAETSLTVNWGVATDATNTASELEYKLVRSTSSAAIDTVAEVDAILSAGSGLVMDWNDNVTTSPSTGLQPRTTYYYALLVRDPYGNKMLYAPRSVLTPDITPPVIGAAINFTNNTTETSVTVNWGAATDNGSLPANLQYKLVSGPSEAAIDTIAEASAAPAFTEMDWSTNVLSKNVSGLSGYQNYHYVVLVRDETGNTSIYTPASIMTLDTTAPNIGSGLVFTNVDRYSVTTTWGSGSDTGGSNAIQYKVVRASAAADIDTVAEVQAITGGNIIRDWGTTTTYDATGIMSLTTHFFNVIMRDGAGNLAVYSPASFKTPGTIFATNGVFYGDLTSSATDVRPESAIAKADYQCNHDSSKPADGKNYKAMIVLTGVRVACTTANCTTGGANEHVDWVLKPSTVYKNPLNQVVDTTSSIGLFTFDVYHADDDLYGLDNPIFPDADYAWTGMLQNYTVKAALCQNWSSKAVGQSGSVGISGSLTNTLMSSGGNGSCAGFNKLICVEQ
jgi:hypothetical protein